MQAAHRLHTCGRLWRVTALERVKGMQTEKQVSEVTKQKRTDYRQYNSNVFYSHSLSKMFNVWITSSKVLKYFSFRHQTAHSTQKNTFKAMMCPMLLPKQGQRVTFIKHGTAACG